MTTNTNTIEKSRTYYLVINALFIALTLVATWLINIRLPFMGSGGLIHLGNVPLFLGAMLFGRRVGMTAGAVGMGLFDLLSGWAAWAPFTAVIAGTMGYVVGAHERMDRMGAIHVYYRRLHGLRGRSSGRKEAV